MSDQTISEEKLAKAIADGIMESNRMPKTKMVVIGIGILIIATAAFFGFRMYLQVANSPAAQVMKGKAPLSSLSLEELYAYAAQKKAAQGGRLYDMNVDRNLINIIRERESSLSKKRWQQLLPICKEALMLIPPLEEHIKTNYRGDINTYFKAEIIPITGQYNPKGKLPPILGYEITISNEISSFARENNPPPILSPKYFTLYSFERISPSIFWKLEKTLSRTTKMKLYTVILLLLKQENKKHWENLLQKLE